MKNKDLCEQVEELINGARRTSEMKYYASDNAKETFFVNTVKRLAIVYDLFKDNKKYKEDYLIALRDYLIISGESIRIDDDNEINENVYGIGYDEITNKYFASYHLPKYVNGKFVEDVFHSVSLEEKETNTSNLCTDAKIYELTGYKYFKSMAQKLAVYGALKTPEGYTTLISLPTGGGKSLVTQTISYQKEGLTIVVVPTISLAIDQVRVTKAIINRSDNEREIFSYSSGNDAKPIVDAIAEKRAKILFISPEALLENPLFAEAIKNANKNRYLKNIVIDEAHIVVDWGSGFRVDYQCLESWRNMLLMTNPSLRTILLSATYEDKCVEVLKNFFSLDNRWIEIRCDSLRHEPRYNVIRTKSNQEKDNCIVELVRKLPHPMIIYVAKPADANQYKNLLKSAGINNVRTYTGFTNNTQRKIISDEWVTNKFQIMIATSAFGVGVDKGDVRTVIHTYIPQNANTYYQELGRGGRDKLPCLSIMCLNPDDSTIGRDRITKKVLTTEKICGRWDSLYNNEKSKRFSGNRVLIDTSIKPNYADIDEYDDSPTSDADMNWNVYVLLFLRRYNMIRILEVTIEKKLYKMFIEIIDDRLLENNSALFKYIEQIREEEWQYYKTSYNAISRAVSSSNNDCMAELFTETYSKVYDYCAGCNAHNNPIIGDLKKFPLKNKVSQPLVNLSDEQIQLFGDTSEAIVFYDDTSLKSLLDQLIEKRISLLIVPDHYKNNNLFIDLKSDLNVMILGLEEAYQLTKKKAYYYLSGMVAVLYPEEENDIGQQFVVVRNNFVGRNESKIIHIVRKNVYVKEAGKKIKELVDGPNLQVGMFSS